VSRALLKVRALDGMTIPKAANALACSPDTIKDATNELTLLTFDKIARLIYLFPEQCEAIFELWNRGLDALTAEEHKAAIEHHTAALVRLTQGVKS
jgi:hypothetical protein